MKNLTFYFILLYCSTFAQMDYGNNPIKLTPFDPKGNYETVAIKTRLLPWFLGNVKGYNALLGIELGFFKAHSISADIMKNSLNNTVDAYYKNDTLIKPSRNRNEKTTEHHFSYNYHFNINALREESGLSFYTGINYRIGKKQIVSDTGMYFNDHTVSSTRNYYSVGPQIGTLINLGEEVLALNVNITTFYNVKNVSVTEMQGADSYTKNYTFKTIDFRLGLNLYFWIKYCKK